MTTASPAISRPLKCLSLAADLVVVGGGIAGICCAITAARQGMRVALVQDRPVLGGNASSEVRLWVLGATSHMYNDNRWAREGGVINELLLENFHRNPEGNALIFDTVLLEAAGKEGNITLFLNTAVFEAAKKDADTIGSVRAFCSQNSTLYDITAPLFCDASGDGILGFMAGAAFRMGAEPREAFGEKFVPDASFGELLGHSMYFYTKDTGRPVKFVPPSYALDDITKIPRHRSFNTKEDGCRLWWIEYGGRLDTVHETEQIKWELWKVVYGVWNHIKNSGQFPDADNLTLEWVGQVPGKRESRRFEGDVWLTQQDIIEQRDHPDAVAHGGWALDLHPADGVYSAHPGCTHWQSRGVYGIPYRALYSRNLNNLFLAGRTISASHVAFGSTRVMGTLGAAAQAVGVAAALCLKHGCAPRGLLEPERRLPELLGTLARTGQYIPGYRHHDKEDLAQRAALSTSGSLRLEELRPGGPLLALDRSRAQLVPMPAGRVPAISCLLDVAEPTTLELALRTGHQPGNFSPEKILAERRIALQPGLAQAVAFDFETTLDVGSYVFITFGANPAVQIHASEERITGLLALRHLYDQTPPGDIGVDPLEFWTPERRPAGHNLALQFTPALEGFGPDNVTNGVTRPTHAANAWVAAPGEGTAWLEFRWQSRRTIGRVEIAFDPDWDHPLESVLFGHPERVMPFTVRDYRLLDGAGHVLHAARGNHQARNSIVLDPAATTDCLRLEMPSRQDNAPAAIFEVSIFGAPNSRLP